MTSSICFFTFFDFISYSLTQAFSLSLIFYLSPSETFLNASKNSVLTVPEMRTSLWLARKMFYGPVKN
jgi:hypothetical protein